MASIRDRRLTTNFGHPPFAGKMFPSVKHDNVKVALNGVYFGGNFLVQERP